MKETNIKKYFYQILSIFAALLQHCADSGTGGSQAGNSKTVKYQGF